MKSASVVLGSLLLLSSFLISGGVQEAPISHDVERTLPRGADPSPTLPVESTSWHLEQTWYKREVPEREGEDRPWPILTPRRKEKTVFLRLTRRLSDEDDIAEELSVEVSYEDIYDTLVFLTTAWTLGFLCTLVGMPSLVGEICAGFLLGPPLADYVPFPEAMVLIGEIGLLMLLLEAGIEVDIAQLKETGVRSVCIALVGATFSLGVGLVLAVAVGEPAKSAFAVGASFAPTSIGVASNALAAGQVLNTPVGQLIIAAGVIDDIIGLIILAMLEVVVDEDAKIFEYFIPIISSVGFLVVLGGSALTWMPRVIQNRIFPLFPEKRRDLVGMALMMALVLGYLPLLFYSRASYLTGAFLAGLTFSQIDSVHATFVQRTHHIMEWLLRIFFAASIGFQVPIKMFGDSNIIGFGFLYYLAVLAKLPLGVLAPRFQDSVPEGFPFNPNKRDSLLVGLAMSCRGEFSFIIAAFSLGEGLLDAELYSSIVFAVLLSAITSPFALLTAIKYYNKKSEEFLDSNPLLKDDAGSDDTIPLYLAIQGRTENQWGLQEKFRRSAEKLSLTVIDHRSWHPRGAHAVVVTELYVQDTSQRIHNPTCYLEHDVKSSIPGASVTDSKIKDLKASDLNPRASLTEYDITAEDEAVQKRIEEVRAGILQDLGPDSEVVVSQWLPHVFQPDGKEPEDPEILLSEEDEGKLVGVLVHMPEEDRRRLLDVVNRTVGEIDGKDEVGVPPPPRIPETPASPRFTRRRTRYRQASAPVVFADEEQLAGSVRRIRRLSSPHVFRRGSNESADTRNMYRGMSQPILSHEDLWDVDEKAQDAAMQAIPPPPEQIDLTGGPAFGVARRRKVKSDLTGLMDAGPTVEERLGGHVRRDFRKEMRKRQVGARGGQLTGQTADRQRRRRQHSHPPLPTLGEHDVAPLTPLSTVQEAPQRRRQSSAPPLGDHDVAHIGSQSSEPDMFDGKDDASPA